MKVYIANNLVDGPYGGGNQFLKFLRDCFRTLDVYSEDPLKATVILFNSHQNVEEVYRLKRQNPSATFIHRLDGPMRLYNNMEDTRDMTAYQMNTAFADAVIFQSHWSKQANLKLGLDIGAKHNTVIHNGTNISPVEFQNITNLGPLEAQQVAEELKKSDIYITASENDPCSNSLIEALSSGLPAVYFKSGGHSELVKEAGLAFKKREEIFNKLEYICDNYLDFRDKIKIENMSSVANKYVEFFSKCM